MLSSQVQLCADPYGGMSCGGNWDLHFSLPTAYQTPTTIDLSDPIFNAHVTETGQTHGADPDDCPWGGGTAFGGTVVIQSIDENGLQIVVSGTTDNFSGLSADGTYNVVRCF